jgi:cellulose synthase/poly-beta-1,6-N-acetylglucosamine synthase-like glycosyltransferase
MIQWETLLWLISYIFVAIGLSAFGAHKIKVLYGYWRHRKQCPEPMSRFAELPQVTIQLPVFNEADILDQLMAAMSALEYPKDRLQIQILDDSTDETADIGEAHAEKLRALGFEVEYRHRTNRRGFKAGAMDEGHGHSQRRIHLHLRR